jgi:predicted DNA-binding antitoxin AbrB/MazE fold protein
MTADLLGSLAMSETLPAVFENGVFRPLRRPTGLAEHRQVTLTVDVAEQVSPLSDVAGSLSSEDAQEMREIIEREFERVDPREW